MTAAEQAEIRGLKKRNRLLEQENYILRRAAAYLSQAGRHPLQRYPLVADLADEGIAVTLTCRVLGFSKQAYFKWRAKPCSDRDLRDALLINTAVDVHHDDPTLGYRFIADELKDQGFVTSETRVGRLCSLQGIWSLHAKNRGRMRRPGPPMHDDLRTAGGIEIGDVPRPNGDGGLVRVQAGQHQIRSTRPCAPRSANCPRT